MIIKKIFTICCFFFYASHVKAQKILDTIPKEFYSYDYSNRKYINMSGYYQEYEEFKSANLIVINHTKIVSIDDKAFTLIPRDSITSIQIIKDDSSSCAVKCIVFIETK